MSDSVKSAEFRPNAVLGEKLIAQAEESGCRAISFDVFDTVVTRQAGCPEAIFLEVGRKLVEKKLISTSPEIFASLRTDCEMRARVKSKSQEVSLEEIYDEVTLSSALNLSKGELIEMEEGEEKSSISLIPGMKEVMAQIREKFGKVIFVSDIYLSTAFVREFLERLGLCESGDSVYVSSEYGLQKFRTGDLFAKTLELENLRADELLHCGNSAVSDVAPAEKKGIKTYHLENSNDSESEKVLNKRMLLTEGVTAAMAGASRNVRLEAAGLEENKKVMWDTGAGITGPLAYLYAHWVVRRAQDLGVQQLLFLARDSYFPYLAVSELLKRRPELEISASYVYGSRPTYYALRIEKLEEEEWCFLTEFAGESYVTLQNLQKSLMMSDETMKGLMSHCGFTESDFERELNSSEESQVKSAALEDREMNESLMKDLRSYQELNREYLSEKGVASGSSVALVDSGWTTRSHRPLFEFLGEMGCREVRLFYIGLDGKNAYVPLDRVETFMFNEVTAKGVRGNEFLYARPLESLFISPEGRTRGFKRAEGKIETVHEDLENPDFVRKFYPTYEGAVRRFLDVMWELDLAVSPLHDMRTVAHLLVQRFWMEPSRAEAAVWSKLSWEWDPLGSRQYPLAKAYQPIDLLKAFRRGRWPVLYDQFWVGGAKSLSDPKLMKLMKIALAVRRRIGLLWSKIK